MPTQRQTVIDPNLLNQGDNSVLGNFGTGLMNFLQSGSPASAIGNLIRGVASGQATDPYGVAIQNQRAMFQNMVAAGYDPRIAQLALQNPDVMNAVIGQQFPKYEWKNLGDVAAGAFNPYARTAEQAFSPLIVNPKTEKLAPGEVPYQPQGAGPIFPGAGNRPVPSSAPSVPFQRQPLAPPGAAPGSPTAPVQREPLPPPAGAPGPAPLGQGTPVAQGAFPLGPPMTLQEKEAQIEAGKV